MAFIHLNFEEQFSNSTTIWLYNIMVKALSLLRNKEKGNDAKRNCNMLWGVINSKLWNDSERNTSYSFLLLLSLGYKFITIFKENIADASIWYVRSHISWNTHCKFSTYLSNGFTSKIIHSRHLINGKSSYILHSSPIQHDLRSIMRSYVDILNLVFDLSSYLKENIISTVKTRTCILMWGSLIYQIFNKLLKNLSKVSSTKFHENLPGGCCFTPWRNENPPGGSCFTPWRNENPPAASCFTPWRKGDGEAEMTRIIVAFCNYVANSPKERDKNPQ
jgi:hypothetical protein